MLVTTRPVLTRRTVLLSSTARAEGPASAGSFAFLRGVVASPVSKPWALWGAWLRGCGSKDLPHRPCNAPSTPVTPAKTRNGVVRNSGQLHQALGPFLINEPMKAVPM